MKGQTCCPFRVCTNQELCTGWGASVIGSMSAAVSLSLGMVRRLSTRPVAKGGTAAPRASGGRVHAAVSKMFRCSCTQAETSSQWQTLDAQLDQLRADGCAKLYREKASGAQADRRELLKLLKNIIPGDVVTVTRIDRLARSTFDLFAIVKRIVDAGGQFRSLAEPWADTATSTGRLMIAVLGGLADVERDLIRTRTAEGRSRAKARGQQMGRTPSLTPQQQQEARQRRAEGATLKDLAHSYNVSMATISRLRA
jgi:DNA invertase Pin-like site-specific DNA recombinase